jgi:DNA ligase-1
MVGRGELGGFIVRALDTGVEFRLGYNHVVGGIDRVSLWRRKETLVGRLVKFRHQPSGAKEAPRFPKFLGFRESWDLSSTHQRGRKRAHTADKRGFSGVFTL